MGNVWNLFFLTAHLYVIHTAYQMQPLGFYFIIWLIDLFLLILSVASIFINFFHKCETC